MASKKKKAKATKKLKKKPVDSIRTIFTNAPKGKYFRLLNGRRLKNVAELIDALEQINDDIYHHHANQHRNDFSNWLNDVFKEKNMAKEMKRAESRLEAQRVLLRTVFRNIKKMKK